MEWGRFPDGDLPPEGDFLPAACILGWRGGSDGGELDCCVCSAGELVDVPCLDMADKDMPSFLSLVDGGSRRGNRGGSSGERLLGWCECESHSAPTGVVLALTLPPRDGTLGPFVHRSTDCSGQ